MKTYKDTVTGERILEVSDLSFLKEREHPYGWFKRHYLHFGLHLALRWADKVYASDSGIATDLVRYYFVPGDKISIKKQTCVDQTEVAKNPEKSRQIH